VPEGDTILRTARTLRAWLDGRTITAARSPVLGARAERLVGRRVTAVEARGKHLLVRLDDDTSVHTHMRMTGSWHVYSEGERWRRPESQARLVLSVEGGHVAVCFNAPVVELLSTADELLHPSLRGLGPDVLVTPLDVDGIRRRARALSPGTPIGDVLLDQRVVSGIGNIYRCDALFVGRVNPATPVGDLDDAVLDALVSTAAELLRASVDGARHEPYVHRRTNRPCRRCGAPIRARRQGADARTSYWCPRCQPEVTPPGSIEPR
jgi:endonuclease-8